MPTVYVNSSGAALRLASGAVQSAAPGAACCCGGGDPCSCSGHSIITATVSGVQIFSVPDHFNGATGGTAEINVDGVNFNQSVALTSPPGEPCPDSYTVLLATGMETDFTNGPFDPDTGEPIPYEIDFILGIGFAPEGVSASIRAGGGGGGALGALILAAGDVPVSEECYRSVTGLDNILQSDGPNIDTGNLQIGYGGTITVSG